MKSSKVVSVSERDAVACSWFSEGCSDPRRESPDMATGEGIETAESKSRRQAVDGNK